MAMEDSQEGEKKELQIRVISLESQARQLETKTKNYADQISRFEEREAELKKEYNSLHQRHTEMIHSYMEHLERTKHQHGPAPEPSESAPTKTRKERPISIGLFQLPGADGLLSDPQRPSEEAAELWRFNNLNHPRSNTSLKDELSNASPGSKSASPSKSIKSSSSAQGPASELRGGTTSDGTKEATEASNQERGTADGRTSNFQGQDGKPEADKENQKSPDSSSSRDDAAVFSDGADELEKSAVQAIIESTPELDMELEGLKATSTPSKGGVENLVFDRNTDSLFEELSSAGNDLVGDVDEGADLLGMGREVEHLIQENTHLLEIKNALNVVKNDLIGQLDEMTCEKEVLQGELTAVSLAKAKLEEKNKELEDEIRKLRTELEEAKHKVKNDAEDDSDVPTAQRKRFTRVEMARVLMERNQYKERLMELQEAVRWTEMIRASKENPALPEKKKSSLWQLYLGQNSVWLGQDSVWLGQDSVWLGQDSVWFGQVSVWLGQVSVWLGQVSVWLGQDSVWLGQDSVWLGQDSVWLGQDSVWFGQVSVWLGQVSVWLGQDSVWLGQDSVWLGQDSVWLGQDSVRLGQDSVWLGQDSVWLGQDSVWLGQDSVWLGQVSVWLGQVSVRLGQDSVWLGQDSVWLGQDSVRLGQDSVWLGQDSVWLGQDSVWLGQDSVWLGQDSVWLGQLLSPFSCLSVLSFCRPLLPHPYPCSFSRLFSSSGAAAKKPAAESPVNVKYNAPTAQVQPSVKKKSSTLQQLPSDKSKAFDFLNEEAPAESVVSRREQKRAQYQQVKAHVQKEDGRVQAYGWSLPKKYKANGGQAESKLKNLPVPVFLRPLDEKDASMKLWCAAGVNLSGGRTRDGGSIVGASVFYSDAPAPESPHNKRQSSLDQLDQELKEQQQEHRQQEELSSLVWICTSTQSTTKAVVIDANQPGNILESFLVCSSHVLCITSVPGARETDYPAGEETFENPGPSQDPSSCASPTPESEGLLGGIKVLGCTAEGASAPQSPVKTNGDSRAEEAVEASEGSPTAADRRGSLRGAYTEHVYADPLGADTHQHQGDAEGAEPVDQGSEEQEQDLSREEAQRMSSVQPTMWLGAQNGCVYVHSSVAQWKTCLHTVKLKDSVLGIVHVKGRVLVGLSDGTIAIFQRGSGENQ
uniref:RH2 domain-containing protein n=1 Tax=Knipowitschia caucasica TaxID=637954 RepID=A0AAV2MTK5_KNICA